MKLKEKTKTSYGICHQSSSSLCRQYILWNGVTVQASPAFKVSATLA